MTRVKMTKAAAEAVALVDEDDALATREFAVQAVTQADLEQYLAAKQASARANKLRLELLDFLLGGAWIEPGPLRARVEIEKRKILSRKALVPVIGEDSFDELLHIALPTDYRQLLIEGGDGR